MFNDNSIIKDVNVINKLVSYLIVIIGLFICSEPIFMLFINLFLLLITKQYPNLFKTSLINTIIIIITIFFTHILWITKLLTLVIYTVLLKKVTKSTELRYILESTLYHFQSKKITYYILYVIYFARYYRNNINKLLILKDDYSMKLDYNFIKFIIQKSYQKTKAELKDLMEINNLRFYNYSKQRTYVEKPTWESWDTNYIVSHLIILLLTLFYGR